jgi:hypothetical protein
VEKAARVIAALSPMRAAGALTETGLFDKASNLEMFRKVWDAYQKGGIEEVTRVLGPMKRTGLAGDEAVATMESQVTNVLKALQGLEIGGDDALKIRNFAKALMGDRNAVVLDTWMKRIFYPKDFRPVTIKNPETGVREAVMVLDPKTGQMVQKMEFYGAFSPAQYRATEQIVKDFAAARGVMPADVQAAMWVGIKIAKEGRANALRGGQPFLHSFKRVWEEHGRDLSVFGEAAAGIAMSLATAGLFLPTRAQASSEAAPFSPADRQAFIERLREREGDATQGWFRGGPQNGQKEQPVRRQ